MGITEEQDGAWTGYSRGSREYTRMLIAMFAAGLATFAQLYSPQGILPSIASALKADPATAALIISSSTLGLALFAMVWAYCADLWGKSRAMYWAVSLATVLGLIAPWIPNFHLLLVLRFFEGAALAGLASLAVAFIAEETNPLHAGAATGLYVAGTSLGGLVGRLLAAPVAELTGNWRLALVSVSALGGAAAITFILLLPKPQAFTPVPFHGALRQSLQGVKLHLSSLPMLALYLSAFTMMGSFITVFNYVGFKLEDAPYRFSPIMISLLFLVYLLGTVSSSVSGRWVERWGKLAVLTGSIAVLALGIALTLLSPLWAIILGLVFVSFGFFCGHSVAAGWVGARAVQGRAQATALYNISYYTGSAVMGYVGGLFYNLGGWLSTGIFLLITLINLSTVSTLLLKK